MFEICYLHIGSQKTGSTSIQHTLKVHADLLEQHGFHYPSFQANHAALAMVLAPDSPRARNIREIAASNSDKLSVEETQTQARQAFEASCRASTVPNLVLSSEHFSVLSEEALRDLVEYLSGFVKKIVVICYVRHPAGLVVSWAQQRLKSGTFSLENRDLVEGLPPVRRRLETWAGVVGEDNMTLRPFDRGQLQDGDVVADFLAAIGLAPEAAAQVETLGRNESLSFEAALIADAVARQHKAENVSPDPLTRKQFSMQLQGIRGGKFALSDDQNAAIRAAVAPEAQALQERFGLTLPDPVLPRLGELWGQNTIEDVARLLYGLSADNRDLNIALKKARERNRETIPALKKARARNREIGAALKQAQKGTSAPAAVARAGQGKPKEKTMQQTGQGPTFICPGAQKAGTTWLNHQLKQHPDFWMPPQKELDYLDDNPTSREKYAARMGAIEERLKDKPKMQWRLDWWRLFNSEWDLHKYPDLFARGQGKLTGDISPNYSGMSAEAIKRAAELVPAAKIVILMRDPVDRAWSHARHTISRGPKQDLPEEEKRAAMVQFAQSPRCFRNSDYATILQNWRDAFGADQVHVAYYDDLVGTPVDMLNGILDFLGAAHLPADQEASLREVVNKGESHPCPADLRAALVEQYAPMLERLRPMLPANGRPAWLG